MSSRLINVRLDAQRLRKARRLREKGVVLSELVREAIDAKFEALEGGEAPRDPRLVIARLFEQYPDPPGTAARRFDPHDRGEARKAVLRKLSRKGK